MTSLPESHEEGGGAGRSRQVRVGDLLRRTGTVLDCPDDRISKEDALITGELVHSELRRGLVLHGGDVIEERAFTVTSQLREGLACIFFLDGEVDIKCGDRRFAFKGDQHALTGATAIMCATAESFQRASLHRQRVRHLVVSATPEWLDLEGLEEVQGRRLAARLFKDHLADHRWIPSQRVLELVREIVAPATFVPELQRLHLEGRAVQIVAETIAAVMRVERNTEGSGVLTRRDRIRLQRAMDAIAANRSRTWTVEAIAREAGVSASGLQRLFRLSESSSVFGYVRRVRLERALQALRTGEANVQEASVIAGYSSPANFATAFRRKYGFTPREALASRPAGRC